MMRFFERLKAMHIMLNRRTCLGLLGVSLGLAVSGCGSPAGPAMMVTPVSPPSKAVLTIRNDSPYLSAPGVRASIGPNKVAVGVLTFASAQGSALVERIILSASLSMDALSVSAVSLALADGTPIGSPVATLITGTLVFDLAKPLSVPDGGSVTVTVYALIDDGLGARFQVRLNAATDIVAHDPEGLAITQVIATGSEFPLKLNYVTVVRGSFIAKLSAASPDGSKNLVSGVPSQVVLVADLTAYGEDAILTDFGVFLTLTGLNGSDLANLNARDDAGVLIGPTVTSVPNADPRLDARNLAYAVPKGTTKRLLLRVDIFGTAGSMRPTLVNLIASGAASGASYAAATVSGASLPVV